MHGLTQVYEERKGPTLLAIKMKACALVAGRGGVLDVMDGRSRMIIEPKGGGGGLPAT